MNEQTTTQAEVNGLDCPRCGYSLYSQTAGCDSCGFCGHSSIADGVCVFCGALLEPDDVEEFGNPVG